MYCTVDVLLRYSTPVKFEDKLVVLQTVCYYTKRYLTENEGICLQSDQISGNTYRKSY